MSESGDIVGAVGGVSKAVSSFLGMVETFYRPIGIVREAKAEAAAAIIRAHGEASAAEIREEMAARTAARFLSRELRRQENIDAVVEQAARYLPPTASVHTPDQDWMSRFFSDAGDVSDDQLRKLFARVLAHEAQRPGGCSRRTLSVLRDLQPQEAELFRQVASHAWIYEEEQALLLNVDVAQGGVRFTDIFALAGAGLTVADNLLLRIETGARFSFHAHRFTAFVQAAVPYAEVAAYPLTDAGSELARVVPLGEPMSAVEAGKGVFAHYGVELRGV